MSDAVILAAIAAKRAEVESKRLHALAAPWEIESAEKYALLYQTLRRDDAAQYVANVTEATYFERMPAKRSFQELEDDADFTVAAYSHDLAAHSIADKQLDCLEEVGDERSLLEDGSDLDSEYAENRLIQCVDSIYGEPENAMVTVT